MALYANIGANLTKAEEYIRGLLGPVVNGVPTPVLLWAASAVSICSVRCVYNTVHTCIRKSANTKKRARKKEECKSSFDDLAARLQEKPMKVRLGDTTRRLLFPEELMCTSMKLA